MYYETLGISKQANSSDIKAAYRKLALKSHPDKPDGNADLFKAISEAYEVLSDTERRATYDLIGVTGVQRGHSSGPTPEEIFRSAFDQQLFGNVDAEQIAALFQQMSAAAGRTASPPRELVNRPVPMERAEFDALVDYLRAELVADDLEVPASAVHWSAAEVRTFFERGGSSSGSAIWEPLRPWTPELEDIGRGAPSRALALWVHPMAATVPEARDATLLRMLDDNDEASLVAIVAQLARDGAVALRLGLDADLWEGARHEAEGARGFMAPATLPATATGSRAASQPRGDWCIRLTQYAAVAATKGGAPCHVLWGLHEALCAIGVELGRLIDGTPELSGLELTERSDLFVTCVPAGQAVAAHFDSACTAPGAPLERKLCLTAFFGSEAARSGGSPSGAELLYDQHANCWHSIKPDADTLLLTLADRVLHKVEAAETTRLSACAYFLGGYPKRQAASQQAPRAPPPSAPPPAPAAQAALPLLVPSPSKAPTSRLPPPPSTGKVPTFWQPSPTPHPTTLPGAAFADSSDDDSDEEGAMDELG